MNRILLLFPLFLLGYVADAQVFNAILPHDGETREFIYYQPTGYDGSTPYPVVIALHGLNNPPVDFMPRTDFNVVADTAQFIPVYPAALSSIIGTSWNSGTDPTQSADDVGFISALIAKMDNLLNVDLDRIYIVGFSQGGFLTNRLACEIPEQIAAIASVAGTMHTSVRNNCSPSKPMPALHCHGTSDNNVNINGNFILGLISAQDLVDFWVDHNNCSGAPVVSTLPDTYPDGLTVDRTYYPTCDQQTEVDFYKVNGLDHEWTTTDNDIFYSETIWRFFQKYGAPVMTTSMEEPLTSFVPALFPNPVSDRMFVRNTSAELGYIYDVNGRLMQTVELPGREEGFTVDRLIRGLYFLELDGVCLRFIRK